MHALGVVAANYNHLEFILKIIFYHYMGLEHQATDLVFAKLNNNRNRLDMLAECVETREKNSDAKDRALHFIRGFALCADNRNFLMHGRTDDPRENILVLVKASRNDPKKSNYLQLTVREIQAIADEIYAFDNFGLKLYIWLTAQNHGGMFLMPKGEVVAPTLPDKPALPKPLKLTDSRPPKSDEPRPEPPPS